MDKTTDEAFTNLGLPQLLALANFSSDGDQFFGLILSIIGVINLSRFGNLLLKLASNDPSELLEKHPQSMDDTTMTHLLRSPSEDTEAHTEEIPPCQLFWALMMQEVSEEPPLASALEKLRPFLEEKMAKLELQHQRWLLFFALPGALARHSDGGSGGKATLNNLICQTTKINATTALEAATGDLSFKVTFSISKEDASNGWGVFLQPEAEYYDFEHHLNEHRSAIEQTSHYARSVSSNSKGQQKGSSKGASKGKASKHGGGEGLASSKESLHETSCAPEVKV